MFFRTVLLSAPNSAKAGQIFHPTSAMGFSAVYCTACHFLLFAPVMATSALQSRTQHCKSRNCAFAPFIDIFRQHCKIAIIHPQQPLRHCRALCQGCNAADSDLWYNLPDVFDETIATQCAARMVIGAFTASSFFHNQPLKLLADHTVPRDRKSTRLNSSHLNESRMPSSA